jgi:hypothetical protein
MRLHLDPALSGAGTSQSTQIDSPQSASAHSSQAGAAGFDPSSRDSVAISGTTAALSRLTADRSTRLGELAASVQAGTYGISSSTLSGAIVAHAVSG